MTNAELNLAIAKLVYPDRDWMTNNEDGVNTYWRMTMGDFAGSYNYCNNWNDLMPLVVEHRISLCDIGNGKSWDACAYEDIQVENENPQRALAECLLKVLESKQ